MVIWFKSTVLFIEHIKSIKTIQLHIHYNYLCHHITYAHCLSQFMISHVTPFANYHCQYSLSCYSCSTQGVSYPLNHLSKGNQIFDATCWCIIWFHPLILIILFLGIVALTILVRIDPEGYETRIHVQTVHHADAGYIRRRAEKWHRRQKRVKQVAC